VEAAMVSGSNRITGTMQGKQGEATAAWAAHTVGMPT
jgi:hypothetical protein